MKRKTIQISSELDAALGTIQFDARIKSEMAVIRALLEGAIQEVSDTPGYVFLAFCKDKHVLIIDHSYNPEERVFELSLKEQAKVEILTTVPGSKLLEIIARLQLSKHNYRRDWYHDMPEVRNWFEDRASLGGAGRD